MHRTAGYIANDEIKAILGGTGTWKTPSGALQPISSYSTRFDEDSHSNIAVYDSTQWVAYMDDKIKADRTITDVSFQLLTLQSTNTDDYKLNPVQSITPSSFVYTLPPNHATFPVTTPAPATSTDTDIIIIIINSYAVDAVWPCGTSMIHV